MRTRVLVAALLAGACVEPGPQEADASAYVPPDGELGGATGDARIAGDARPPRPDTDGTLPPDPPDAAPAPEPCGDGDSDHDGYGEGAGCAGPDCDDENAAIHPEALEACNGADEDCDGTVDEGLNERLCGVGACQVRAPNCVDGHPQACMPGAPAAETCNGLDDDCDGTVDEEAGVTLCGLGLCERRADCVDGVESNCTPGEQTAEVCDGQDNDCDGAPDNGFRAVVHSTSYATLRGQHDVCDGGGERVGPNCNAAIHRFCVSQGCTASGFGPLENSGDNAAVGCVAGGTDRQVAFATLAGHQGGCDGRGQRIGPECNAAIHRYCRSEGFASGFGPIESGADAVTVTCLPGSFARVIDTTYGTLAGHLGDCNQGNFIGSACNAAISRFCAANGAATGFGPVEHSGDTAVVTCVSP